MKLMQLDHWRDKEYPVAHRSDAYFWATSKLSREEWNTGA